MNAVNVDIRMLRKGTHWCAVAHVVSPHLAAPLDLFACCDIRQTMAAMPPSSNAAALASSEARRQARRQILAYTYNFFRECEPEMGEFAAKLKDMLEACDKACDLVTKARGGDVRARAAISSMFQKAKGGDASADKSARLVLESADLIDDGRTSFRVAGMGMPVRKKKAALSLPMRGQSTGAEGFVLNYPGSSMPNTPGFVASDAFVLADSPYLPYPYDRPGDNFMQNFQPAVAPF